MGIGGKIDPGDFVMTARGQAPWLKTPKDDPYIYGFVLNVNPCQGFKYRCDIFSSYGDIIWNVREDRVILLSKPHRKN
jgi:hypothetical protein